MSDLLEFRKDKDVTEVDLSLVSKTLRGRQHFECMDNNGWTFSIHDDDGRRGGRLSESSREDLATAIALGQNFLREALRRRDYLAYLDSDEWQQLRLAVLSENGSCAVCTSTTHLDVHHRTYERFGHEALADLIVLCRDCHDIFHKSRRI